MREKYNILPSECRITKIQTFPKPAHSKESTSVTGFNAAKKKNQRGRIARYSINTQLVISARMGDSMKYRRLWLTCAVSNPSSIHDHSEPRPLVHYSEPCPLQGAMSTTGSHVHYREPCPLQGAMSTTGSHVYYREPCPLQGAMSTTGSHVY